MIRRPAEGVAAGYTTVELLVALIVLAVGIVGLSATVNVVGTLMTASLLETRLSLNAQAVMETLAAMPSGLADGQRSWGGAWVTWEVSAGDLRIIRLEAHQAIGAISRADTLVTALESW